MYHSFLIHSSADGHLGCFHVPQDTFGSKALFCVLLSSYWSQNSAVPPRDGRTPHVT